MALYFSNSFMKLARNIYGSNQVKEFRFQVLYTSNIFYFLEFSLGIWIFKLFKSFQNSFFENTFSFPKRFYGSFRKVPNKNIGNFYHISVDFFYQIQRDFLVALSKALVESCSLRYLNGLHFIFLNFQKTYLKCTSSECSLKVWNIFASESRDKFFICHSAS